MNDEGMEPKKEKRMNERSDCKGLIKWSYFNQTIFFNGNLLNFSKEGSYFETPNAIHTGATIFVRFIKYFPENLSTNDKKELHNVCLGKVKHCNEIIKDNSTYYGVGIKYI